MYYKGDRSFKEHNAFMYPVIFRYIENKIKGRDMVDFFRKNYYESVAIYGLGSQYNLGELLYEDICLSGIKIKFFIDKYLSAKYPEGIAGIPVIPISEILKQEQVDVIIITPVFYSSEIMDDLTAAGISAEKMITLAEIVFAV